MFLVVGLLAARAGGSEDIRDMGGIAFRAPVLAALFLIATLATLAMPGSANFVGEFMILLGVFNSKMAIAIIASIGVVLASVYALRHVHPRDAQPAGPGGHLVRDVAARRAGDRAAGAVHLAFALYPQQAITLEPGERGVRRAGAGRPPRRRAAR